MDVYDYLVNLMLAVVIIIGGYQFYFFPQKNKFIKAIELRSKIDNNIPFRPRWVWVYSGLYYPIILALVFAVSSFKQFNYIVFSFVFLLICQLIIFFFFPIQTPKSWRDFKERDSISIKFLNLVHSFDDRSNCFPSMHVSVATLTAFHLMNIYIVDYPNGVLLFFLFPLLISLSTLYTKQHYFIDIPAGILLGYFVYLLFMYINIPL